MDKKPESAGPGVGVGIATGVGLQFLGLIAFQSTALAIPYPLLKLWPFILITVLAVVLLFSKRWRPFAAGVIIVAAATWIVVIGPCYELLSRPNFA